MTDAIFLKYLTKNIIMLIFLFSHFQFQFDLTLYKYVFEAPCTLMKHFIYFLLHHGFRILASPSPDPDLELLLDVSRKQIQGRTQTNIALYIVNVGIIFLHNRSMLSFYFKLHISNTELFSI